MSQKQDWLYGELGELFKLPNLEGAESSTLIEKMQLAMTPFIDKASGMIAKRIAGEKTKECLTKIEFKLY